MKKLFTLWAVCLLSMLTVVAQDAIFVENQEIVSPEVNADGTVTFRLVAPKAITAQVWGDFLPGGGGVADMKEENGVWTYTSEPLNAELYAYYFVVNGQAMLDPQNTYLYRNIANYYNYFIVSREKGDNGDLYTVHEVPHGDVDEVWYDSPTLGMQRRMLIYTPAGYDKGGKFPVLYLFHGAGGDEEAWIDFGRAAQIMDNLIAEGKAQPMIVVMPNGVVRNPSAPEVNETNMFQPTMMNSRDQDTKPMEDEFPTIKKFVETTFRVKTGQYNTAVAGLSMGGRHSFAISRRYPGTIGYVGMFSGAGSGPENEKELKAFFAAKPKLYWIAVGSADGVKASASALRDYCKEKGYPCEYYESDGGHIWKNWRVYLTMFAQKLWK